MGSSGSLGELYQALSSRVHKAGRVLDPHRPYLDNECPSRNAGLADSSPKTALLSANHNQVATDNRSLEVILVSATD